MLSKNYDSFAELGDLAWLAWTVVTLGTDNVGGGEDALTGNDDGDTLCGDDTESERLAFA